MSYFYLGRSYMAISLELLEASPFYRTVSAASATQQLTLSLSLPPPPLPSPILPGYAPPPLPGYEPLCLCQHIPPIIFWVGIFPLLLHSCFSNCSWIFFYKLFQNNHVCVYCASICGQKGHLWEKRFGALVSSPTEVNVVWTE